MTWGTMNGRSWRRLLVLGGFVVTLGACATAQPTPEVAKGVPPPTAAPPAPVVAAPAPPPVEVLPEVFESDDFLVTMARPGDTSETLAARLLGDAAKAWMIEDYTGSRTFEAGTEVVVPRRPWNPAGVTPTGYQIVPVLCYHNLGPQQKGRMMMAVSRFEEQMRYLRAQGYRVISLAEFLEYTSGSRQLPRRSVVLTFDDGYKSFREYAYPLLKELGFSATLFVYTDYVGAGRNALSWQELKGLSEEGFDVQAHSKTHGDLRRAAGEADATYARRMQAELGLPMNLFRKNLGRPSQALAYPYGYWDEDLLKQAREFGYVAAFTVRRQANSAFVAPLRINRSQIYAEMTIEDFAKNLNVFHAEDLR